MNYESLKKLLSEAKLYFLPESEKTILSIGGRGHFENPISDILSFFFNPQEVHGFGTLFLDSFFSALELVEIPKSLDLINSPKREITTDNSNRIDILLEGNEWVLIIENKIFHYLSNPLSDYEQYIADQYKEKTAIFVVLSPQKITLSSPWRSVSYKNFLSELKQNMGNVFVECQYSKWFVFLRDFILNLGQHAVRGNMDSSAIQFIENNYQDVTKIVKLREDYINHVQKEGLNKLRELYPDQDFKTTIHNWNYGPAIRYYSESWVNQSNLVIQISHREKDKGLGIIVYAYDVPESKIVETDDFLKQDYFGTPWTEAKTIRCYKSGNRYSYCNNDFLYEFEEVAKRFDLYNKQTLNKT